MSRRLVVHLSYVCRQRCVFCAESESMARHAGEPLTAAEVGELLRRKRAEGFEHCTLTGGEPTEHPSFAAVAASAKRLGFQVRAESDGGRLADPVFAERVLPWLDELSLSLHGPDAATHDACTGVPGSFEAAREALENAARAQPRLRLATQTVVTALNVDKAVRTLEWLLQRDDVCECVLSNPVPEGRARRAYKRLAVPLARWRELIPRLAELADLSAAAVRVCGLPLCVFGPHAALSGDLYRSPSVAARRGETRSRRRAGLVETTLDGPAARRVKPEVCSRCGVVSHCGGVFEAYAEMNGAAELRPAGAP